jgi:apolipoprotein N-acyltransferase
MSAADSQHNQYTAAIQAGGGILPWALAGGVLMSLCQPPLAWSSLAWIAPIPWLVLADRAWLPGRRPYRILWMAGILHWLAAIHWLRLPHPLNYLAWPTLAAVMGAYLPLFVLLARTGMGRPIRARPLRDRSGSAAAAVELPRRGLPISIVAPIAWTAVEWLRAHLLSGFFMGSLAHTQVARTRLIQCADLAGEYGVTFLMVLFAASIVQAFKAARNKPGTNGAKIRAATFTMSPALLLLAIALGYGTWQLQRATTANESARLALIQGYTRADWKSDPARQQRIMEEYLRLSHEAVAKAAGSNDGRPIDLIIWPETAFRTPLVTRSTGPDKLDAAERDLEELGHQLRTAVLVGLDRYESVAPRADHSPGTPPKENQSDHKYHIFNSAVMADRSGKIVGTYDKMHRVMFGEYIPLANWFPFLYRLTPVTGSIEAGKRPEALLHNQVLYAPNICYETVLPHVIRRQVAELCDRSMVPDVLVNLTNDAWFWGSSELEMHLACGVFRAVEMRTPLLIVANGGLSAHIDSHGRLRQVSGRSRTETIIVDLDLPQRRTSAPSIYAARGDWFAIACLLYCMVLAIKRALGAESREQKAAGSLR